MDVSAITSGNSVTKSDDAGLTGLKAEDFLEMLIVQLKNQDPTEPITNDQLLSQISTIQGLQSNLQLADAITATTTSRELSTAAGFIGKQVVAGTGAEGSVEGIVERAFVGDGDVFVTIDGRDVPLNEVHTINALA